jgi:hypothetical protein
MNKANTASYDVSRAPLPRAVRTAGRQSWALRPRLKKPSRGLDPRRPASAIDTAQAATAYGPLESVRPAYELRESPFDDEPPEDDEEAEDPDSRNKYAIPDVLSRMEPGSHADAYAAAEEHALQLRRAEGELDEAINLVAVLLGCMQAVEEAEAMQVETVARLVKARLDKVYRRIDRHGIAHTNLFLAYFELKAMAESGGEPGGNSEAE